jgi:hypothetical protein
MSATNTTPTTTSRIIDWQAFYTFLENAVSEYQKTAPTVADYCDHLYRRINNAPNTVFLQELLTVERLLENGQWMLPNYAANTIYKLMHSLGIDTTGHAGF